MKDSELLRLSTRAYDLAPPWFRLSESIGNIAEKDFAFFPCV
jgi:hypothetical protein